MSSRLYITYKHWVYCSIVWLKYNVLEYVDRYIHLVQFCNHCMSFDFVLISNRSIKNIM